MSFHPTIAPIIPLFSDWANVLRMTGHSVDFDVPIRVHCRHLPRPPGRVATRIGWPDDHLIPRPIFRTRLRARIHERSLRFSHQWVVYLSVEHYIGWNLIKGPPRGKVISPHGFGNGTTPSSAGPLNRTVMPLHNTVPPGLISGSKQPVDRPAVAQLRNSPRPKSFAVVHQDFVGGSIPIKNPF